MILKGDYNYAKVFIKSIDKKSKEQIIELLNQEIFEHVKIRIMPDVHAGIGCVIGFTADLGERIIPNLVGVDIGCGMLALNLGDIEIDFNALDRFIRAEIPYGKSVNNRVIADLDKKFAKTLKILSEKTRGDYNRNLCSLGSLGSGNHFIEINVDKNHDKWLVIHSGSRNLGHKVATYHQNKADNYCSRHKTYNKLPKHLRFLEGDLREDYLKDMAIAQRYASINREVMARQILKHLHLDFDAIDMFETVHNYINFEDQIVRKGAVAAYENQKILIPINMRDGSIIAIGKGNEEWNYSAPHGAGRLMSRKQAQNKISIEQFRKEMSDIWTTSVKKSTLDEAPMAYKPIEIILNAIEPSVQVIDIIKPLYNFKA